MHDGPAINLDLSKPFSSLIDKFSEAIRGRNAPSLAVKMAKAEAEAVVIKANAQAEAEVVKAKSKAKASFIKKQADLDARELEWRTVSRLRAEEMSQQANLERILALSEPALKEDAKPHQVENDWLTNYGSKARSVSGEEMQLIWSRILAGEAEVVPGVVESRHTLAPDRFRCRDASPPADPAPSSPRSATIVRLV